MHAVFVCLLAGRDPTTSARKAFFGNGSRYLANRIPGLATIPKLCLLEWPFLLHSGCARPHRLTRAARPDPSDFGAISRTLSSLLPRRRPEPRSYVTSRSVVAHAARR